MAPSISTDDGSSPTSPIASASHSHPRQCCLRFLYQRPQWRYILRDMPSTFLSRRPICLHRHCPTSARLPRLLPLFLTRLGTSGLPPLLILRSRHRHHMLLSRHLSLCCHCLQSRCRACQRSRAISNSVGCLSCPLLFGRSMQQIL